MRELYRPTKHMPHSVISNVQEQVNKQNVKFDATVKYVAIEKNSSNFSLLVIVLEASRSV